MRQSRCFEFAFLIIVCCGYASSAEQQKSGWSVPSDLTPFWVTDGPTVCVDEGHHNFHTSTGRFAPFAELLRADGYHVLAVSKSFDSTDALDSCGILVIANALSKANAESWALPVNSAFSEKEIKSVNSWISNGGRLLLIADHMPFAGAVEDLAKSFGFVVMNGYTVRKNGGGLSMEFSRYNGLLNTAHPIFKAPQVGRTLDRVLAYEGHAFRTLESAKATPLFTIPKETYLFFPKKSGWNFEQNTPMIRADGFLLGATRTLGNGRLAIFSEAGMFTSQTTGDGSIYGFGDKGAEENHLFVLALMGWLSR